MILFITGPSGAGKSTLARAWVASREHQVALIDADQITSWMRLGETSAVGAAVNEGAVERIAEQYRITAEVYVAAARQYDANGIDVVIAQLCGYDPPPPWSRGWDLFEPLQPTFVVLYPESATHATTASLPAVARRTWKATTSTGLAGEHTRERYFLTPSR